MKHKLSLSIFAIATALTMSSCGFISFITNRLTEITISDATTAYQLGDVFYSASALTITGKYSDDTTKEFTLDDVSASLTLNSKLYNIKNAFTRDGDYSFYVTKDNVKSNTITVHVYEETQYVENISVSGETSMYVNNVTTLNLSVSPAHFTVEITATSSDTSIATVNKVKNTEFTVSALDDGEVDITFKALRDESNYVTATHHITIERKEYVDMAYTYEDVKDYNYYNVASFPLNGTPKVLIVPVWFTDSSNYITTNQAKNNVRSDIETAYLGTTSSTGWHSVTTYYKEESSNRLNIQGIVSDWWSCGFSAQEVSNYSNSNSLAIAAAEWYFNNNSSESRTDYDYNNDGYLDAILLIYAAPDLQKVSSFGENMWAYCFWVQDTSYKSVSNPGVNTYFWASYDFMYGSNKAYNRTGTNYCNGDTSHCTIDAHTYIHEMGHVLGLDDYYDYAPSDKLNPAGGFSMQDCNVGGHDAFSLTAFGWTNVYVPDESCELTIADFQSSKQVILLTPSWNSYDSPFDEYVLAELYAPTGLNKLDTDYQYDVTYPRGANDVGIRLWHVDARLVRNGYFTSNAGQYGIRVGMNNTSKLTSDGGRTCDAGAAYQRYNLLQLIRNDTNEDYQTTSTFVGSDLFKQGSSFSMSTFSSQFQDGNKLNNGSALGWEFTVNKILLDDGTYKATLRLTRN